MNAKNSILALVTVATFLLAGNVATAAKSRTPEERYGLPTVDSALKITQTVTPTKFPRLLASIGFSVASINQQSVSDALTGILSGYDAGSAGRLESSSSGLAGSLRLQVSRRLGFWFDFAGKDAPEGEDGIGKAATSFGLLFTPLRAHSGAMAVSIGTGYAYQKLWSHNSYSYSLPNNGTLERIDFETTRTGGVPLMLTLELPAAATSRYSLTIAAKQIFSEKAKVSYDGYGSFEGANSYEIDMSGLYLSAMLTVGL
ncbi:MAG: hypothetical protein NDJ18_08715 [candidate division Zixibacteria bacterium]|nr:hypothetical protein [candidate division Zixibacteria bacterium]